MRPSAPYIPPCLVGEASASRFGYCRLLSSDPCSMSTDVASFCEMDLNIEALCWSMMTAQENPTASGTLIALMRQCGALTTDQIECTEAESTLPLIVHVPHRSALAQTVFVLPIYERPELGVCVGGCQVVPCYAGAKRAASACNLVLCSGIQPASSSNAHSWP